MTTHRCSSDYVPSPLFTYFPAAAAAAGAAAGAVPVDAFSSVAGLARMGDGGPDFPPVCAATTAAEAAAR